MARDCYQVLRLVLVHVTRQVELIRLQAVDIQNGSDPIALPCCDREEGPRLDATSRDRGHAVAKHVLRLKLVVPKVLLDRMRLDPLGGWGQ